MDPEDPFAGMDPEAIRRGSFRTLQALFPELFGPEPEPEGETDARARSGEQPAPADEDEDSDLHSDENGMRHAAGSADG